MSRLKSELWVRAYLRRLQVESIPAVIVRRGHAEAGAIFISVNMLDTRVALYGPAPAGLAGSESERRFVRMHESPMLPEAEATRILQREASFDADLWIVEIEDREGRHRLEDWLADPNAL